MSTVSTMPAISTSPRKILQEIDSNAQKTDIKPLLVPLAPEVLKTPKAPSQRPKFSDKSKLNTPLPLLPTRSTSPPKSTNLDCKMHADRLKARLRLAYYKVVTDQTDVSLAFLPSPQSKERKLVDSFEPRPNSPSFLTDLHKNASASWRCSNTVIPW